MKTNRIRHPGRGRLVILSLVVLALVTAGLALGYNKLRDLWLEQCVIRDMDRQVSVESGEMVKADVIAENLGLRTGGNLATIDFKEKREALLRKVPNLRDIRIRRFLPDRVSVTIEERKPIARVGVLKRKTDTGKVADAEGMVFFCARGTKLLPVILEKPAQGTSAGHRLENRAQSALRLICACHDTEFQELGILDVDITHPDWLLATINTGSSYARLKIAWEGMDAPETPDSHASLVRQLTHLRDAIRTHVGDGAVIWNATDYSYPGRIYADTKGKL